MRAPRFIAWGELLWDLFPDGSRLGGAPANAAYHSACLGARATLVSRVGNDGLGSRALEELSRIGIDTRAVQLDPHAPTGTVQVTLHDGEPQYSIAKDVAWDEITWQDGLIGLFSEATVVCFGTLAQRGPRGFQTLERALAWAPKRAIRLCDLNLREPFVTRAVVDRALSLASVVKLNEAEVLRLEQLFEQRDVVSWLLRERGVELVAVTRGSRGASLITLAERCDHPGEALSATDGDAVGAGDSFSAALSLSWADLLPLSECLASANRYAAHVASNAGAMPPPPEWLPGRALTALESAR